MFASAEGSKYEAWFLIYEDFVSSGVKSPMNYAIALESNDIVTTKMPKSQTEAVLLSIRRCVGKYGTIAKVKTEHAKWCKANRITYADITNLRKFAPEGQRAKGIEKKAVAVTTKTWGKAEYIKALTSDLVETGMPRAMAKGIAEKSANKHFINK